jgi:hypothetical protein
VIAKAPCRVILTAPPADWRDRRPPQAGEPPPEQADEDHPDEKQEREPVERGTS